MAAVTGKVKWFNATKGYGFVTLDNGGDAFCHASALAAHGHTELAQGTTITCDLQESPRGLQITSIHSIDTSTADPSAGFGGRSSGRDRGGRDGDRFGGDNRFGNDNYGGGDRFGGDRYGDDRFGGDRFGGDRFGGDHFGGDRFGGDRFGGGHYGGDRFGGDRFGGHDAGRRQPPRDSGPSGPMVEGTVKFFNEQKGFGFVMPQDGSGDIYLHASALRRSGLAALNPEQRILYSTRQGMKGVEVDRIEVI